MHGANCLDFGVVIQVRGGEGLTRKVGYPITEIVVTRRDEASLLAVKGVAYVKRRATSVAMVRQVRGVDAVS